MVKGKYLEIIEPVLQIKLVLLKIKGKKKLKLPVKKKSILIKSVNNSLFMLNSHAIYYHF